MTDPNNCVHMVCRYSRSQCRNRKKHGDYCGLHASAQLLPPPLVPYLYRVYKGQMHKAQVTKITAKRYHITNPGLAFSYAQYVQHDFAYKTPEAAAEAHLKWCENDMKHKRRSFEAARTTRADAEDLLQSIVHNLGEEI